MPEGLIYQDISSSDCAHVVNPADWRFDGIENNVQPGDIIGIPSGQRNGLQLKNIHGTLDNPVIITNIEGLAEVGLNPSSSKGFDINNCSFFKLQGTGSTSHEYGIALKGYFAVEIANGSTDFEVFGLEVLEAGYAGITARSNATCDGSIGLDTFTQYNTIIHHNYVHDTGGEGLYIGGSHWGFGYTRTPGCEGTTLFEPELKGVRIYNNIVRNTNLDGIQVGGAVEDCEIYNNLIENFGQSSKPGHMSGFQINPGTGGKLYNNIINGGNGFGIFMFGSGGNTIYNNLIIDASYDGIYDGDRTPFPGMGFNYINNSIIRPGGKGYVSDSYDTVNSVFYNNVIAEPGKGIYTFGYLDNIDIDNNTFTDDLNSILLDANYLPTVGSPLIGAGRDVSDYGIDSLNIGYYEKGGAGEETPMPTPQKKIICDGGSVLLSGSDANLVKGNNDITMGKYYKNGLVNLTTNRGEKVIDSPEWEIVKITYTLDDPIVYVEIYHEVFQGSLIQSYTGTAQIRASGVYIDNKIDINKVVEQVLLLPDYQGSVLV